MLVATRKAMLWKKELCYESDEYRKGRKENVSKG